MQRIIDIRKNEIAKINEQYLAALERQKKRYIHQGDFDNAKIADDLLKKEPAETGNRSVSGKDFRIEGKWEVREIGSNGVRFSTREFKGGGVCVVKVNNYEAIKNVTRYEDGIFVRWGSRAWEYIFINPKNPNVLSGINHLGVRYIYKRLN